MSRIKLLSPFTDGGYEHRHCAEPESAPITTRERAAIMARGGASKTMLEFADDLKANFGWVSTQPPDAMVLTKPRKKR